MISEYEVVLGDRHFDFFEDIVNDCPVPKQLLLIEVVDKKGLVFLDVSPCHQVRKPVRMEADQSIHFWPLLNKGKNTDQCCSRYCHISIISISLHFNLLSISFIGLDCTFFFIAHTPKVTTWRLRELWPFYWLFSLLDFRAY